METKIHEFNPVIYPRLLWIAVNPQGSNLKEYFEDYDFTFKQQRAICCGVTKRNPRESGFLIVFKSIVRFSTLLISSLSLTAIYIIFTFI
jgi:hypothetical protein